MTPKPNLPEKGQYLNPAAAAPKYFHFATVICQRFCHLPVGSVLPALTELAERFSVSKETINRSMRYLVQLGYVKSERGRGTYILRDLRDALTNPVDLSGQHTGGRGPAPVPASAPEQVTTIGLVLKNRPGMPAPDRNSAEVEIVAGLQHRLQQEGIMLATVVVNDSGPYALQNQLNNLPFLGGYVFMTRILNREEAQQVALMRRPSVVINEDQFSDILTCITACESEGMQTLIRHLYHLGHRKVVYLSHAGETPLDRYRGFEKATSELSGTEGITHLLEETPLSAVEKNTLAILKKYPQVTAYVAGGAEIPQYFCRGLHNLGLKPGREISVAGFGVSPSEWNSIADDRDKLTTIVKPRYEMGRCAAETLIQQIRQKYQQSGVIRIPTSVQEGTTTGPVYEGKITLPK